ncbi:MAG: hypothetical protein LBI87_03410 [Candidatus Accumulibacter sp.]|jgi:hypothetical protein|nr:hypothetical protein [Accumulibacter sp.]
MKREKHPEKKRGFALIAAVALAACSSAPVERDVRGQSFEARQLAQSDANRFANLTMRDNLDGLEILLEKLYRRNPAMWKKRPAPNLEAARGQVMAAIRENAPLPELGGLKGAAAVRRALAPEFTGDRAGAYIYGLGTMLAETWGGRLELSLIDGLDAQRVANAAHNVMVAAWLLTDRKDAAGRPLLLSNEISAEARNLSFEREHGKIIGRLDTLAAVIDEKYRRGIIGYLQGLVAGSLLQFLPVDAATAAVEAAVQ